MLNLYIPCIYGIICHGINVWYNFVESPRVQAARFSCFEDPIKVVDLCTAIAKLVRGD